MTEVCSVGGSVLAVGRRQQPFSTTAADQSLSLGLAGITAEVPTQNHSLAALALGEYRPTRAPCQF